MPLSVVMPAHNQAHSLELALTSLTRQTLDRSRFEVVLVDDCSIEDLAAVAARFSAELDLTYLRNPVNLGRARTRNRGVAAGRHDDVLLLDADSYCTPDLLERHERFADRPAGAILLGRRLEPDWTTLNALIAGRPAESHSALEEDPRYHLGFQPESFAESRVPWLFAYCNNMSVSRKLLDAVGGFNEDFVRWGYEDNELAYRIFRHHDRTSGWFRYDPQARTYHLPHYRNWKADWAGAQGYIPYFKQRYRHFDVELLGAPPLRVAQAVPHYERCLEHLRVAGPVPGERVAAVMPRAGRELWVGFGVPGRVRCDHAEPVTEDNSHLLGVSLPHPDDSYDRVVNIDVWRMLNAADMSALLHEGLRIAPEVVLGWTTGVGTPLCADLDYAIAMIRPYADLTVDPDHDRGFTLLTCRR